MKWNRAELVAALNRPIGKAGWSILVGIVLTGPAWLFFAPADPVTREPLHAYRLHRDDFEYLARSRTFSRATANLFVPHNSHIVPAWRLVTWVMVVCAGRISRFPSVLAIAAYGILAAAMMLAGRLVARETGRPGLGLTAAILTGTTSVMLSACSWYSAGQTLWAGVGILAMLAWLQRWRRRGGVAPLVLAGVAAMASGWLWTVGHIAGLVGAAYLVADRRAACRRAALVPLLASASAVLITVFLARGRVTVEIGARGQDGGRSAISVRSGVSHTLQAIPETLVLGNLGLTAESTPWQGAILSLALVGLWGWSRSRPAESRRNLGGAAPNPLEAAGGMMVAVAYLVEWTFRGYLPFSSLRWQVPWYDTIPHLGAVLFASGWCAALLGPSSVDRASAKDRKISRIQAAALASLVVALVTVNRPRVDERWHYLAPPMLPSERLTFRDRLWVQRDNDLLQEQAYRQYRHLLKLERVEAIARARGIGLDALRAAFGRLDAPLIPEVYDAAGLLDIPEHGTAMSLATRQALATLLAVEPETRPSWIWPDEPWPPPIEPRVAKDRH
jgi:hypothetical protein